MQIRKLDLTEGNEALELESYTPGFYLANDTLWLKAKDNVVYFICSSISDYIDTDDEKVNDLDAYEPPASPASSPEDLEVNEFITGEIQTITPELLLKAIAVTQDPSLAFKD